MPTLTTTRLLQSILASYKVKTPMLSAMATDFNPAPVRLNETVTAHVRVLPTKAAYNTTTGYANGANSARNLLVDVPLVVDSHEHVPVLWEHINAISDQKDTYAGAVEDAAFVLGRSMVDSVLAKARGSNISGQTIATTANSDLDILEEINSKMNENGASPFGRVAIVNSSVASTLALDDRVASKDFYGSLTGGTSLRRWTNVAGFSQIWEYPGLNANNRATQTCTAATTDIITANGHGFANGDRVRFTTTTTLPAGLAINTTYFVRDATTNTFKVSATDGGTAVDITDTGTGTHSVVGWENLTGLFFERSAIAMRVGMLQKSAEQAAALGIPQTMAFETMVDPETGMPMTLVKWQAAGTGDLYVSPAAIWGSCVGRQAGSVGSITDKGAWRLVSA
jgi:hypothetical protein